MLQKTLEEAGLLPATPDSAWREYELKSDILLLEVNSALENDPALRELIGGNPVSMMRDNHHHHRLFMLNIFPSWVLQVAGPNHTLGLPRVPRPRFLGGLFSG